MRSEATSSFSSATCSRIQASSPTRPSRSSVDTRSSDSPMWRRSVSVRSPPTRARTRAVRPSTAVTSTTAATPRWVKTSASVRIRPARSSVRLSPPASNDRAVWPKKDVSAAARTRSERCGCSIASSSASHSPAAGVWKTDPPALTTDGTPTLASATWTASSSLRRAARTAMSPGLRSRPSKVGRASMSRLMSWAVSVRTWSRHSATGGLDRGPLPSSVRRTTRSRNGAPAPCSRDSSRCASTGCTTMRSSPSCAPWSTAWTDRSSGRSERQLTPSVWVVVAVSEAWR